MIAVPITASAEEEAVADIGAANSKADVIELRLDFLRQVNETVLGELLQQCRLPVIVTFRKQNFGANVEDVERGFLLGKAIDFNADMVDLDMDTDSGILQHILEKKGNTKLIISFHDFDGTPAKEELLNVMQRQIGIGADIVKIVTTANRDEDNETVLQVIDEAREQGRRIIAFCAGEAGRRSRVECIKRGSLLTFASLGNGKESAPGQLTVDEMRKGIGKND